MADMEQGDVVIRPSSKVTSYVTTFESLTSLCHTEIVYIICKWSSSDRQTYLLDQICTGKQVENSTT